MVAVEPAGIAAVVVTVELAGIAVVVVVVRCEPDRQTFQQAVDNTVVQGSLLHPQDS